MGRQRSTFVRQMLVAADTLVSATAFVAALLLRDALAGLQPSDGAFARFVLELFDWGVGGPPPLNRSDYLWLIIGLVPIWLVSFVYARTGDFRLSYRAIAARYVRATLLGLGLFILVIFLFKISFVARTFVVLFGGVQLVALVLARVAVLESARWLRRRRGDGHRVVVVGSGQRALEFARTIKNSSPFHVELLGFVSVPGEHGLPEARPHLGFVGSLSSLLDRLPVDEVVFAIAGNHPDIFKDAIAACDERGVDVRITLPPQVPLHAKMEIAKVSGFDMPLLNLRRTPTSEARLAVKRLIDIFGGLVGISIAAPIMLITAIAIKLDSKGPVFFRQVRAGRNGRKFTMLKFRSMVVDAEAKKQELMHLNEMGGPVFKIKRDPRITKVGRFIRKTSIDELPQIFNILSGDMSIVGPRPPLPSEVEQYEPWQRRRLSVKPGLTGLWQVSGRNQIDFDDWMQLDLEYIDNWSLWLDLKIIFRTVPVVLFHKGAS